MPRYRSIAFCILAAMAFACCGTVSVRGQERGYMVILKPETVASKLAGDSVCQYFLLSNLGYLKEKEVGFQYATPSGSIESDVIEAGKGSVVIDASRDVPAVQKSMTNGTPAWVILISSGTYNTNRECLEGLPLQK